MAITRSMKKKNKQNNDIVPLSSIPHLPTDLIIDIISRIPLKPLLTFETVSKPWYAMIESPSFIEKHETFFKQNPDTFSVLALMNYNSFQFMENHETNACIEFPFAKDKRIHVVGVCNGLVACRTMVDCDIYICNPTTGSFRAVPVPSLPCSGDERLLYGFSFQDKDYSLFRLLCTVFSNGEIIMVRAEVYMMSKDEWKEFEVELGDVVTGEFRSPQLNTRCSRLVIDGVFYWESHDSRIAAVEYFDTRTNMFGEIRCPPYLAVVEMVWNITNLNGKLALLVSNIQRGGFKLYTLNEEGNATWSWGPWSWGPTLFLPSLIGPSVPSKLRLSVVGHVRNGNIIFAENSIRNFLFSFDPNIRQIKCLPFPGLATPFNTYLFEKSLVAVEKSAKHLVLLERLICS